MRQDLKDATLIAAPSHARENFTEHTFERAEPLRRRGLVNLRVSELNRQPPLLLAHGI